MTNDPPVQPRRQRRNSGGLVWKSGLLVSSVGAVLLGWTLLHGADGAAQAPASADSQTPAPRVIVVQMPVSASPVDSLPRQSEPSVHAPAQRMPSQPGVSTLPQSSQAPQFVLPALPERPVFQQPVTRSRAS